MKKIISTDAAPAAIGPYNQAVQTGSLLFTSGQIPLPPEGGQLVEGGIEAQTRQVIANLKAVLEAGGTDFNHVIKSTVFLSDLGDFQAFNALYAECFESAPPARSTIQVARLPMDALVEIEMIAAVPS